jgi:hypothetical protein
VNFSTPIFNLDMDLSPPTHLALSDSVDTQKKITLLLPVTPAPSTPPLPCLSLLPASSAFNSVTVLPVCPLDHCLDCVIPLPLSIDPLVLHSVFGTRGAPLFISRSVDTSVLTSLPT